MNHQYRRALDRSPERHRFHDPKLAAMAKVAAALSAEMVTTTAVTPFPQASPTISAQNLTISVWLQSPPRVQKMIQDLTYQRFIADLIFSQGPVATGGAVLFDQVTALYLFMDRDVQSISPGSEFPIINGSRPNPLVALISKWGGEAMLSDEAIRRDTWNLVAKETVRLRNTVIRKVDKVAVAALDAAPIRTMAASGTGWGVAATSDIIGDLAQATQAVNGPDLGYQVDTALVNPREVASMLQSVEIRTALPRERSDVPIATGNLGRLMGIDFIETNRVPAGSVYVLQRKMIGGISDEIPLYMRPIRDERAETTYLHTARNVVPYVTDPLACIKITGA